MPRETKRTVKFMDQNGNPKPLSRRTSYANELQALSIPKHNIVSDCSGAITNVTIHDYLADDSFENENYLIDLSFEG